MNLSPRALMKRHIAARHPYLTVREDEAFKTVSLHHRNEHNRPGASFVPHIHSQFDTVR